ncbi:integral membrane protein GPR155 [Echinococcus multilocularis]|uniref:Integral membrane protein GPR155 n=1 Tax=Echinococcus multilocularis TaxID=6211 RepID=A0A068Y270_ECHMU|nr:integral membrane protein GPR155 [Echinococcus multilocularis]
MNSTLFVTSESTKDLGTFATTDIADGLGNITTYSASYNHVFAGLTSVFLTIYMLIILGFLVGHFRLLSKAQARGFGRFVYRYAISAILFTTTMTIRLEAIQWQATWSIIIARLLMFFVSTIACLAISRGQLLGLSAIASLLLTDSNDIAVMYPTFQILHPSMAKHCCIVVALQILLLKPITFLLLEMNAFRERRIIQRHATLTSASSSSPRMTLRTLFKILCQILLDPQLIAFCLGLICNVAFRNRPPIFLTHFANTFDVAFTSCALFYLGFVCVNAGTNILATEKPLLTIVLSLKVLVMPILAIKLYNLFPTHVQSTATGIFVLLYSLSPTSATLLSLASRYAVAPNLVGNSIRIGTILFFPCLFAYECILYLLSADPSIYAHFLEKTAVFVSWVSVITGLWTRVVFLAGRKTALMPHRFVICYLDCTLFTTNIVVLSALFKSWIYDPTARITLTDYIKFSFYLSAYYCTRMWTAFICIGMLIQQCEARLMPRRNRTVFYIFGLLAPILLTVSMKIISHDVRHQDVNPFYRYGTVQQKFTLAVLIICFLGSIVPLILQFCLSSRGCKFSCFSNSLRLTFSRRNFSRSAKNGYAPLANGSAVHEGAVKSGTGCLLPEAIPLTNDVEGIEKEEVNAGVIADQSPTQGEDSEPTTDPNNKDGQIHRHFAVVGLNLVGMVFGMCGCLWRLLDLRISTTVIVLEFIDQVFNFGQGFLVFSLYGLDVECISKPLLLICSKFRERITIWFLALKRPRRHRTEAESGGNEGLRVRIPTRQTSSWRIAESFALLHLDACVAEICKPFLLPTREVKRAFVLADFHEWLLKRNICSNLNEVLSLLLSLELNDYARGLSVTSVYALDPESCEESVFEFTLLN